MEFGTVTFFDGRDDKRFGFAEADNDGAKIFFHLNNQSMVIDRHDGSGPMWEEYKFNADHDVKNGFIPRKGNRIIFERVESPKGPRAAKWSDDYHVEKGVHILSCSSPQHQNYVALRMSVEWDVVEITFTDKEFPSDSLFGNKNTRLRALLKLDGFAPFDATLRSIGYHDDLNKLGIWDGGRTFRFKIYGNVDINRLIDLSIGRDMVESVTYDDLTRIRHARHWELEDTATLEEIVERFDDDLHRRD